MSFTGSGTLAVGGLALMGARVFDPSSKKFLSQDPLPPIVGAGWFADSYSFLGHDPVGMIDPWGTRPMSQEEYSDYSKKQDLQVLKTAISWVGTAVAIASVFVPGGPLVALGVAALGSAVSGFAEGMLDENGNFDWGSAGSGAFWGGLIGLAGGAAGKVFSSGKMFLKPIQGVAKKLGPYGQKIADKMGNRFALDKVNIMKSKNLGFSKFGAGKEGFKKYTGEILDSGLSGGVSNALNYTKDTKNWNPVEAALSFGTGTVSGLATGAGTAGFKAKVTDKPYFKAGYANRGARYESTYHTRLDKIHVSRGIQKAVVDEAGTRAVNTAVKPVATVAQNEITHAGDENYHQDWGKTWSEEAQKNAQGSLKDIAKKADTNAQDNLKGRQVEDQVQDFRNVNPGR